MRKAHEWEDIVFNLEAEKSLWKDWIKVGLHTGTLMSESVFLVVRTAWLKAGMKLEAPFLLEKDDI